MVIIERFCDELDLTTLPKIIEAKKIHASTNGVFPIAIPKLGFRLDQTN